MSGDRGGAAEPQGAVVFSDEGEGGFGWVAPEPSWLERASHALAADGGLWLVDPVDVDGLDARLAGSGQPRAVLQLFDRHNRDCAAIAARLAVPHLVLPRLLPGSPFVTIELRSLRRCREVALWWPERGVLVVAEAVGSARFCRAPGCALGLHPVRRLLGAPAALAGLGPERVLCGHGLGVQVDAAAALETALRGARRELPALLVGSLRGR